jgi:phospholipid/cholesterol/gamma-HCH transport system permease protein
MNTQAGADSPDPPKLEPRERADRLALAVSGDWVFDTLEQMERLTGTLPAGPSGPVVLCCEDLGQLDVTGAWLLHRAVQRLEAQNVSTTVQGCAVEHERFLDLVERWPGEAPQQPFPRPPLWRRVTAWLEGVGAGALAVLGETGFTLACGLRALVRPSRLVLRETVVQIHDTGLRAVPIVALISFLMGVVLAYQGARQLREFGAELFAVDLVAIAMWREMAGLTTAIIVAGRSGSAFAATLGTMRLQEEIDALRVMGMDPMRLLVGPRILGLLIALPVLTIIADVVGLAGAWMLSVVTLDVTLSQFLTRLQTAVDLSDFLTGLVKVPVFAFIIAGVGSLRGMEVEQSAEELGRLTTRAVVQSITAVLLADAVFSVAFAELGV